MTPAPWRPLGASVVERGQLISPQLTSTGGLPSSRALVSGRATAIALDPRAPGVRLYAGTATGGVWRTEDAGFHWEPISDQLPSLAIGALALAPSNPDFLYIGTGEANEYPDGVSGGAGVYRYDQTAGTMTRMATAALDTLSISRMVIDPADAEHVIVAASNGVYERTVAGGTETWNRILATTTLVTDLLWDPTSPGYLWAGVANSGIFRRRGTAAFAKLPDPRLGPGPHNAFRRVELARCETAPDTVYAVFGDSGGHGLEGIFRTDHAHDGSPPATGPVWNAIPQPTGVVIDQTSYNLFLAVHPRNPDIVFLGEVHIRRTVDGGRHWKTVSDSRDTGTHADQHAVALEPTTDAAVEHLKLWVGNDGGVWRSEDGGTTWSARNRGLQTLQYYTTAQHPTAPAVLIAGAQDNGVQRRVGTAAFELVAGGDGAFTAIDPAVPTLFYGGYESYLSSGNPPLRVEFRGLTRSEQAGRRGSFREVRAAGLGLTDDALFYAPFVLEPGSPAGTPSPVWVGTDRLYRSNDRGETFKPITPRLLSGTASATIGLGVSAIAIAPSNTGRVYVGTAQGDLFRIDRGGPAWPATPVTPTKLTANYTSHLGGFTSLPVSDIAVHPTDPDTLYLSVGANVLGRASLPVAATSRVFVSTNAGAAFTPLPIPPALTLPDGHTLTTARNGANTVVIDPANPQSVFVGCDVGVFRHDAAAGTVEEWRNGLPNAPVTDLELHQGARLLRCATYGRGVWEVELDRPAASVPQVELHVRDTYVEFAAGPTPATAPDPLAPSKQLRGTASPDILVDTPGRFETSFHLPSTVDYASTGELDYVGFDLLGGGSDPRRGKDSKLYVRIANRGPGSATNVKVRAFWASKGSSGYPSLPSDFWTAFPNADPADTSAWKPVGPARTIPSLDPREPAVVSWSWSVPRSAGSDIRVVAAATSTEDPIAGASGTDSAAAALASRFVAVRDLDVSIAEQTIELILFAVGAAVVIGAGIGIAALSR